MCNNRMFTGKNALVTGASRGIGRAIALKLAEHGATVAINFSSSKDAAEQTANEINASGHGKATMLQFDVADHEAVRKSVSDFIKEHGAIHILVNNAGITRDTMLARMKEQDWDKVININLKGVFNCVSAVTRSMMKERWGRIINIGSVVGDMGNPGQANYAAAKAGIEGFTKTVAREVASRNITANVVAPGFIETDMTAALPDKIKENLMQQIPAGRMGTPEDVAEAVVFLASDAASYITGHVLHINGGLLCD
jgi:3-oxoacyl-[acyl-carrier protein] reductase